MAAKRMLHYFSEDQSAFISTRAVINCCSRSRRAAAGGVFTAHLLKPDGTFLPGVKYSLDRQPRKGRRSRKAHGRSVFQNALSVGVAVVLPPPEIAGNSGVAVQLPPQHRGKLICPAGNRQSVDMFSNFGYHNGIRLDSADCVFRSFRAVYLRGLHPSCPA